MKKELMAWNPYIVTFGFGGRNRYSSYKKKTLQVIFDQRFGILFYYQKILPGTGRQIVVVLVSLPLVYECWDFVKLNLIIVARGEMTTRS